MSSSTPQRPDQEQFLFQQQQFLLQQQFLHQQLFLQQQLFLSQQQLFLSQHLSQQQLFLSQQQLFLSQQQLFFSQQQHPPQQHPPQQHPAPDSHSHIEMLNTPAPPAVRIFPANSINMQQQGFFAEWFSVVLAGFHSVNSRTRYWVYCAITVSMAIISSVLAVQLGSLGTERGDNVGSDNNGTGNDGSDNDGTEGFKQTLKEILKTLLEEQESIKHSGVSILVEHFATAPSVVKVCIIIAITLIICLCWSVAMEKAWTGSDKVRERPLGKFWTITIPLLTFVVINILIIICFEWSFNMLLLLFISSYSMFMTYPALIGLIIKFDGLRN